jgi:lysophospholipase L1-like esterase
MMRRLVLSIAVAIVAAACGGSPTGPTDGGTAAARISRTKYFAFGDSFTAGEVTNPVQSSAPLATRLVLVPSASYPAVLQSRLQSTYPAQAADINVVNAGAPGERILDGVLRFEDAYAAAGRPSVVLLQEGVNGLPQVGPDISTGLMRVMVQTAKNGLSRVFVGSMIPQVQGRPRGTTPVSELLAYNNTLQIMCTQEGVTYVDLYNPMLSEAATLIGSDGLHPTEAGYRRIAELFFNAIRSDLEVR